MTQLLSARDGAITDEMRQAAELEAVGAEAIRQGLADGTIVLPANRNRERARPAAVGKGLVTKVNANLGTSADYADPARELEKLAAGFFSFVGHFLDLCDEARPGALFQLVE